MPATSVMVLPGMDKPSHASPSGTSDEGEGEVEVEVEEAAAAAAGGSGEGEGEGGDSGAAEGRANEDDDADDGEAEEEEAEEEEEEEEGKCHDGPSRASREGGGRGCTIGVERCRLSDEVMAMAMASAVQAARTAMDGSQRDTGRGGMGGHRSVG